MMKKIKLFGLMLMSIFVISCGDRNANEAKTSENEQITLKIATWNVAAKALGDVAKIYEKEHPNIKIEILEVDGDYTKLITQLSAGQGVPDIFSLQIRDVQSFIEKFDGQLADITSKFESDGLKDKFLPAAIKMVSRDNKIFAFPWDIGPVALYYRADMFEKAGVTEKDFETYDGYIDAGKKLQKIFPDVYMTDRLQLFPILFNQLGGSYVKNGKININSPEAKKAYELMRKMQKEKILLNQSDWGGRIVAMNNSKIASVIFPIWYAGTFTTQLSDQKGKWKITEIPAFEKDGNRRANLGGSSLALSAQSKYQDEAYDFVKFALTTTKGEDVMISYGLFPAYTPYYQEANFKADNPYFGMDINGYFAKLTEGIPNMEYGSIMLDASKPLYDLSSEIMNSDKSIDESLKNTAETIHRLTKLPIN